MHQGGPRPSRPCSPPLRRRSRSCRAARSPRSMLIVPGSSTQAIDQHRLEHVDLHGSQLSTVSRRGWRRSHRRSKHRSYRPASPSIKVASTSVTASIRPSWSIAAPSRNSSRFSVTCFLPAMHARLVHWVEIGPLDIKLRVGRAKRVLVITARCKKAVSSNVTAM